MASGYGRDGNRLVYDGIEGRRDERTTGGFTNRSMSVQENNYLRYRHNGIPRYPNSRAGSVKNWTPNYRNGCAEHAMQYENHGQNDLIQEDSLVVLRRPHEQRSNASQPQQVVEQQHERIVDRIRANRQVESFTQQQNRGYSNLRTPPSRISSWNSQSSIGSSASLPGSYNACHITTSAYGYAERHMSKHGSYGAQNSPRKLDIFVNDRFDQQRSLLGKYNRISRQSSCSCLHCHQQQYLPQESRSTARYHRENFRPRHIDRSPSVASESCDGGSVCSSLYSHDPRAQKRAAYFNSRADRLCRPINCAAPFIICNSCNELCQIPNQLPDKKHLRMRCGSCSELIDYKPNSDYYISQDSTLSHYSKNPMSNSYESESRSLLWQDKKGHHATSNPECHDGSLNVADTTDDISSLSTQNDERAGKQSTLTTCNVLKSDGLSASSSLSHEGETYNGVCNQKDDYGAHYFACDAQQTQQVNIDLSRNVDMDEFSAFSGKSSEDESCKDNKYDKHDKASENLRVEVQAYPNADSQTSNVPDLNDSNASYGITGHVGCQGNKEKDDSNGEVSPMDAEHSWSSDNNYCPENDSYTQEGSVYDEKSKLNDENFDYSLVDDSQTPIDNQSVGGFSNSATSQLSIDIGQDEERSMSAKTGDSFFGGLMKRGLKDLSLFNQPLDKFKVTINGQPISDRSVKRAEKKAGPIEPGSYWYDSNAGFWGVIGHECIGIIPPFIKEFSYPMLRNCSGGDTGVLVNGRELHAKDLALLVGRGLPPASGKSYTLDMSGKIVDVASGKKLRSLGKLAPTVEKLKRGFGMHVPDEFK